MKLNANEIIKALECCTNADEVCDECILLEDRNCGVHLLKNALALIKQLTDEVADLKAIAEQYQKQFEDCAEDRARLTDENVEIGIENFDLICELSRIKENTVREMQTRLAQRIGTYTDKSFVYVSAMFKLIDQIAKELIGDE